jgi:hypothetical protein
MKKTLKIFVRISSKNSVSAHFNSKLQKAATASATEEARKLAHLQTL